MSAEIFVNASCVLPIAECISNHDFFAVRHALASGTATPRVLFGAPMSLRFSGMPSHGFSGMPLLGIDPLAQSSIDAVTLLEVGPLSRRSIGAALRLELAARMLLLGTVLPATTFH
jgi:hypothetical protein